MNEMFKFSNQKTNAKAWKNVRAVMNEKLGPIYELIDGLAKEPYVNQKNISSDAWTRCYELKNSMIVYCSCHSLIQNDGKYHYLVPKLEIRFSVNTHYEDAEWGNASTIEAANSILLEGDELVEVDVAKLLKRVESAITRISSIQDDFNKLEYKMSKIKV